MKGKTKAIIAVFVVILAGIYYYAAIPAINIHSSETWFFIMIFLVILAVLYLGRKKMNRYEVRESKVVKGFLGVIVFLGVVYLLGTLFSYNYWRNSCNLRICPFIVSRPLRYATRSL